MKVQIQRILSAAKNSFWLIPSLMALLGIILGITVPQIDSIYSTDFKWKLTDAAGARAILSTIAASSITVAGVVFSITMVVLSSAANQYGPRLMRNFIRQRQTKIVLGGYISIFIYCIIVTSTIREADTEHVPQIAVTLGMILGLLSFALLIAFIHHVTHFLQVSRIINDVALQIEKSCGSIFPLNALPEKIDYSIKDNSLPKDHFKPIHVKSQKTGYLQAINLGTLFTQCGEHNAIVRVHQKPGAYILQDDHIATVWKDDSAWENVEKNINNAILTGLERTETQDIEFAIDQLVEVAVRAMSKGINDPFTAINCIHKLSTCLMGITTAGLPGGMIHDPDGKLRLALETYTYRGLVDTAFYQIRQNAKSIESVSIALMRTLVKLSDKPAPTEFTKAIKKHADLLLIDCQKCYSNSHDLDELSDCHSKIDAT